MTEAEWKAATDPLLMLRHLWRATSDRKFRLFGCACVRSVWGLTGAEIPSAIRTAEEFADLSATRQALKKARASMRQERHCLGEGASDYRQQWLCYWLVEVVASEKSSGMVLSELSRLSSELPDVRVPESNTICELFREVFGNPFKTNILNPSWRTEAVVALARGMYESRDFGPMPVFADALEDAGCADPDVLAHCRGGGPHVRGCWVVDLVLGKE